MVLLRKRMPDDRLKRLARHYIPKQKQIILVRTIRYDQSYTWIMGEGEENRDPDDNTKEQTTER